jgi:hypothetical protein
MRSQVAQALRFLQLLRRQFLCQYAMLPAGALPPVRIRRLRSADWAGRLLRLPELSAGALANTQALWHRWLDVVWL